MAPRISTVHEITIVMLHYRMKMMGFGERLGLPIFSMLSPHDKQLAGFVYYWTCIKRCPRFPKHGVHFKCNKVYNNIFRKNNFFGLCLKKMNKYQLNKHDNFNM